MKIIYRIEKDFLNPEREGEKRIFEIAYPSEIHTAQFTQKVSDWAKGAVVKLCTSGDKVIINN